MGTNGSKKGDMGEIRRQSINAANKELLMGREYWGQEPDRMKMTRGCGSQGHRSRGEKDETRGGTLN